MRGFFDAYDAETGKRAWRFYTVPGDPSKPFEQPELANGGQDVESVRMVEDRRRRTGAGMASPTIPTPTSSMSAPDNRQPWTEVSRGPGDNLFADCILAVRGATGKLVWYYQEVPGDDWDFDSIADLMLADLTINGSRAK